MNIIIKSTQLGSDTIHDVIPTKCQRYPSNTILENTNVLDKVNKLPYWRLLNMTSHDAYSIKIHVRTMTLFYISHQQNE